MNGNWCIQHGRTIGCRSDAEIHILLIMFEQDKLELFVESSQNVEFFHGPILASVSLFSSLLFKAIARLFMALYLVVQDGSGQLFVGSAISNYYSRLWCQ